MLSIPLLLLYALSSAAYTPKSIMIDTDLFSDVDDIGALAIANVLHNCGLADLKAVLINTPSEYGALAANSVNVYYGNADVPIGALRPLNQETFVDRWGWKLGEYASKLAHNFPLTLHNATDTLNPVTLYRTVLASAPNTSLTLISIGFLINLADLLSSPPDALSPLTGSELLAAKVLELVIMGGMYPSGWEYNFAGENPEIANTVLSTWPANVPIVYAGAELGSQIWSGQELGQHAPKQSPVLAAYRWYGDRCNTTRKSYDPVAVIYGVLGIDGWKGLTLKPMLDFANADGYNTVDATDGTNTWIGDAGISNQHWLKLADDGEICDVEGVLNQLLAQGPESRDCPMEFSELSALWDQVALTV